jgi:nitrate/TMAO reductase-like tetraheme cytochrome c subunit
MINAAAIIVLGLLLNQSTAAVPHEIDPVLFWMRQLSIGFALSGIVITLFLVFAQRHLGETVLKAFCVGALMVLPLLLLGTGGVMTLEQAKRVEFCQSCHLTMGSFVEDMRNPESDTLAARHSRHRWIPEAECYRCHTSYGMFGDIKAKAKGVEDVLKYYTRSYQIPIRLRKPYVNSDCLKCHERTPKFIHSAWHAELLPQLRSGEFSCMDCHGPAHAEQVSDENSVNR